MAKQLEEFPNEIKENLMDGSREIFVAAYNSASSNGMDEESALQVAWNSIKTNYTKGEDGKWRLRPQESPIHNKAITTGGN